MIKTIISPANPIIKHVVTLHSAKYRAELQEFIAEGFRTISTIIKAGHPSSAKASDFAPLSPRLQSAGKASSDRTEGRQPITLFTTEEFLYDAQQLTDNQRIVVVSPEIMDKISTAQSPSGLLATFRIFEKNVCDGLTSGIVLAQVTDPGNMGTLIRTAAAMNKKTVVCIETVDPWNPKVVQATAGAIGNVSIFRMSWQELMEHKKNIPVYALVPSEGKHPDTVNLRDALIVVGSESHGIPQEWVEQCDEKITLPMPGNFESLNAAIAGSITLYLSTTQKI